MRFPGASAGTGRSIGDHDLPFAAGGELTATGFRFRPPSLEWTPALSWVLRRAFGPASLDAPSPDGKAAVELARELGLAARIAARHLSETLIRELGSDAAAALAGIRAQAVALDLRLEATLAAADEALAEQGAPYGILKGMALAVAKRVPPGGRPATDVDLLVPERRLASLQQALLERGFRAVSAAGYEHQAPLLRHHSGGLLELHRALPGVRLAGRAWATFEILRDQGRLEPLPREREPGLAGEANLLARDVAVAHTLAHTLAQHAFASSHRGFGMVADLIDLGEVDPVDRGALGAWLGSDVDPPEIDAALDLARALAAGDFDRPTPGTSPAGRLAAHFVACAVDRDYASALKLRLFERPLSERSRLVARLALLGRTLAVPGSALASRARRPFELVARWRAARRSRAR